MFKPRGSNGRSEGDSRVSPRPCSEPKVRRKAEPLSLRHKLQKLKEHDKLEFKDAGGMFKPRGSNGRSEGDSL